MIKTLELHGISKSFPGVQALDSIDFSLEAGTIGGLIGENGAGKSTLLKVLSGAYIPEKGTIKIDGKQYTFKSTKDALSAGIAVIYQELNLVPEMTVAENMMLGHFPVNKTGLIDFNSMYETATKQLQYIMEEIDPQAKIKTLPIAQRQMIEISKALLLNARIIAFDEPTSSLSQKEIRNLFRIINTLKEQGKTIIYVSHRLEEVFEICDSVTVFRDGKLIEKFEDMKKVNHDILVSKMVGREISDIYNYRERERSDVPLLSVKDFVCPGLKIPASFDLYKGEILGFFGLVGAGRTELMKGLYGAVRHSQGTVSLEGRTIQIKSPKDSIRQGIAFLPEDRKDEGIIPIRSVEENINISSRRDNLKMKFFIDREWEKTNADSFIQKLDIKTPSRQQIIKNLSGGNQQKVILARWLGEHISVLIMDEPTRGIDVGTKNEIYNLMYKLTEMGISIICVSSDLPEIMGICDRLVIMREGKIVNTILRNEMDKEQILSYALPAKHKEHQTA
ncbi:MAG: L-arabinose ABC transporter ATP-binding protein AraG [Sphaerochaetaceae bacterium]|jgi:L-arabinose transport system ATP-binding protein|nr:L-arabinose ABC transporter ATP-binding protein AraG [Sphaerochaetaceae bacterium]NLO60678.1 L-arabinose ABC transporter ATP-binding protein AraG [Spirochaetales bacterium]